MIEAVIYDFGGVFMESPFEPIRQLSEAKGYLVRRHAGGDVR